MADKLNLAQGPARLATPEEIARETNPGYTAPDLHRRIADGVSIYVTAEGYLVTEDYRYIVADIYEESPTSDVIETESGDPIETESGEYIEFDGESGDKEDEYLLVTDFILGKAQEAHFALTVQSVNSYRTTSIDVHDDDSDISEIP